jgi:hypothetical protein
MRWRMMFGNGDAESSGNAGSDFQLNRFGDAGNDLGTTLLIFRATGAFKAVGNQAPAAGVSEHEFNNNVDGGLYGLRVRNSAPTSGHGIHLMLPSVGDNSSCNFITGANSAGYRFGVMSNSGIYNNQSANSNWSDANVKQNIVPSPDYTAFVEQLQFKRFSYVSDPTYETDDVIAQELEALDQSLVTTVEGTRAVYSHRLQQRINSVIPRLIARIKALEAKQ